MAEPTAAPPWLHAPDLAAQKYAEATAAAAMACAEDTKGQTCYICTEAVHWKTKEGLVRMCACRGTAGFAHVSCLAEQAKILVAEAEENNLDDAQRWSRWHSCGLCEQDYHGVVRCALGWACWKTYVGRPDMDRRRMNAMTPLGNGLYGANHYEDALSVQEAQMSMLRRFAASEDAIFIAQNNLAGTYQKLGRIADAGRLRQEVYFGWLKLLGEEHESTLTSAANYAVSLVNLGRFEEARPLLREVIPVARRVLGNSHELSLSMRLVYAATLCSVDEMWEAVTMLEETARTARHVLGGAHPTTKAIEAALREARAAPFFRSLVYFGGSAVAAAYWKSCEKTEDAISAVFVGILFGGMALYIAALGVAIAWNVKGFPILKIPRDHWLTRKYF